MVKSAALKLTLWYLAIIMALSIGFSFLLYQISTNELERGLRRPGLSNELRPRSFANFEQFRQAQLTRLDEGRRHLRENLLLFNLATLVIGGGASYILARRTLHPIEDALEAQSRFTADASHELRTPLTAIQTEIEVALRNKNLTKDEAKQLLESNLEEVAKLRVLSDGLLRLAQQDGKNLDTVAVDLGTVIKEAVTRVAPLAQSKNLNIEQQVESVIVSGDQSSLVDLVTILIDNAIKYSSTKSSIIITSRSHGKQALLSVQDYGHGIKASDLPHIFDRFYRAEVSRSKDQIEGYGLGLSIAQRIAQMHQGTIEVESTPGKGSNFIVKLPVV